MLGNAQIPVGSRWTHKRRGSVAVVLRVEDDAVTFQFPAAQNNRAQGTGRWPIASFLAAFAPAASETSA